MLTADRSANNIGGEAYVLKLRQVPTLSVEDMLIQYNITTKPERWSIFVLYFRTNFQSKWHAGRILSNSLPFIYTHEQESIQ
jgi:hypothetical protein